MTPLVDYGSSEGEEEEEPQTATLPIPTESTDKLKRKYDDTIPESTLPPLPSTFHNLYASNTRLSVRDDPNLHGGRTRVTPHIEGNWPTHLYIEWHPSTTEAASLKKIINDVQDITSEDRRIHTFLTSDLGAPLPLHISLSRPIGFLTNQKDEFLHKLRTNISNSGIKPFDISPTNIDWVPNFSETRWFLVLRLSRPSNNELNSLLSICNRTVEAYGQPPLYTAPLEQRESLVNPPKKRAHQQRSKVETFSKVSDQSDAFHISIAWSLNPPAQTDDEEIHTVVQSKIFKEIMKIKIHIDELKVKVGNEVESLPWQTKAVASRGKGLFGY